jgi:hypothetical protein
LEDALAAVRDGHAETVSALRDRLADAEMARAALRERLAHAETERDEAQQRAVRAEDAARIAQDAADTLRLADEARKARDLWSRLRAAWRGVG